jgi:peptide-methionine (S)-S-oxide reductase
MVAHRMAQLSRRRAGLTCRNATMIAFALSFYVPTAHISTRAAERASLIPPPATDEMPSGAALQSLVLAGGCFWGIQAVYQHVEGVHQAVSGYAGGTSPNPTYEQVSTGRTGMLNRFR